MTDHFRMSNPSVPIPIPEGTADFEIPDDLEVGEFAGRGLLVQQAFGIFIGRYQDLVGVERVDELLDQFDDAVEKGRGMVNIDFGKGELVRVTIETNEQKEISFKVERVDPSEVSPKAAVPRRPQNPADNSAYELTSLFDYALDDEGQEAPDWLVGPMAPWRADLLVEPEEYFEGMVGEQTNPRIIQAKSALNFFLLKHGLRPPLHNSAEDRSIGLAWMSNTSFFWSPKGSEFSIEIPDLWQSTGIIRVYDNQEGGEGLLNHRLTQEAQGLIFYALSTASRSPKSKS